MPSSTTARAPRDIITRFTNCRLLRHNSLVRADLWVSSLTGKILDGQDVFYTERRLPDVVVDLGNRILSPGMIDVQLNGAFGINFSDVPEEEGSFPKKLKEVNRQLISTGVTSYLPTMTSQKSEVYHKLLPHLGPSGGARDSTDGSESLGAHIEGPFLSPTKNGIHNTEVLISAPNGFSDLVACYGSDNLNNAKMLTAAPEEGIQQAIPDIISRGIVYSIGHSEATYEQASAAVAAGATMITHLFNAMRPLHHRDPGVFGVLGCTEVTAPRTSPPTSRPTSTSSAISSSTDFRPFFGLIVDGLHLHPTTVKIAWSAHPEGCILVTDAMHLVGLPDGMYTWGSSGRERIVKTGPRLTLEGSDKLAGSAISLVECVNNFLAWTGASVPLALKTVTETPARVLGMEGVKGSLVVGADADLVVFSEVGGEGGVQLVVDEVWKFGERAWTGEVDGKVVV
ncbi:hypothetical protein VE03_06822 [Pseudogymnoascus sp. 23342-1-I1]|nr:hypothetical protein VE03_06822 [Pseudogymnoascus sp. 23342-1-I1]